VSGLSAQEYGRADRERLGGGAEHHHRHVVGPRRGCAGGRGFDGPKVTVQVRNSRGKSSTHRKRLAAPGLACPGAAGSGAAGSGAAGSGAAGSGAAAVIRRDSQARMAITPRNEAASTKNTAVSPVVAITIPATPGPAIRARPVTVANSDPWTPGDRSVSS
jgi:hypothetical protein